MNKTMTSIAKELNITLSSQDTINYSASTYSEIFMGKYKDKEFEFISFFHELGHIKIKQEFIKKWKYNTLTIELVLKKQEEEIYSFPIKLLNGVLIRLYLM